MLPRKGSHFQTKLAVCSISCTALQVQTSHICSAACCNSNCATDASEFLRKYPWPGRAISDTFDDSTHRKGGLSKKFWSTMNIVCGKTGVDEEMFDEEDREEDRVLFDATDNLPNEPFYWSQALQDNFREELEK